MKTKGRKQSSNIERYIGEPTKYETQMNLKRFAEAQKAIPKKVNDDLDRAHMNDIIDRLHRPKPTKQARLPQKK